MTLKCRVCRKTFRTANGLNWHLEHSHDQVRTFELDDTSVKSVGQVAEMVSEAIRLPATQNELVELIEGVVGEQFNDLGSPTNGLLDMRELDLKVQIRQTIAEMVADSDQILRAHIEHRIDDRLKAVTPINREDTKVEDKPDPLAPYLREWKSAAQMNADTSCPLSASGKRCDHLRPRREHAALRAIGLP